MLGYFSVSNLNTLFTNIFTNITATTTNNFIANNSGIGTNTTFIFNNAAWGQSNFFVSTPKYGSMLLGGVSNRIGLNGSYSTIVGGMANYLVGAAGGDGLSFIGGGISNTIQESVISFIGGGKSNIVTGTGSAIVGGSFNAVAVGNTLSSDYSSVLGGSYNIIAPSSFASQDVTGSSILGGLSNVVNGSYSMAGGRNAASFMG